MHQTIYLDPEDDLPAIRHLLEGAQARRVALILPKGNTSLRHPLALKVLRRYAADLALDVALVTGDARTRRAAREEGLPVLRGAGRSRWRSGDPRRTPAERAAEARVEGLRAGRGDLGYGDRTVVWVGRLLALLLFLVLLVVVAGLAALAVPEAQITLVPYRESVDVNLEIRADLEAERASLADLVVPARVVEVELEERGETSTVSTRDAPDAPATGSVVFINQVAEGRAILPGAIVRTATGSGTTVRFRTVTTATLPAGIGATAEAQIEALQPGPVGNVAAATINAVETAELRGKIRVINEKPTQGGGVKQVGVVTRADMDRLKAQLLQQLQQDALLELQAQLSGEEFLPEASMTVEILAEDYDQFLDAEADVLRLQMRVLATGTAGDVANARLLAFQAIKDRIPATYELHSEEITFALAPGVRMEGRNMIWTVSASAPLVADLEPGAVRRVAAGLTADEAAAAIADSFPLAAPPEIETGPDWIKRWRWLDRVPFLPVRIQVLVLK